RQPLRARLAPDPARRLVERRWQAALAAVGGTQPAGHVLRGGVLGRDAVDELVPVQVSERPVDRSRQPLGGVALAPGIGVEHVADLVAGPAIRAPGPALSQPASAVAVDEGEHAEALDRPRTRLLQELAPGRAAREVPADVARRDWVSDQFGEADEVLRLRQPQQQAYGLD